MSGLNVDRDEIMIDMACNDPDNGLFAGRVEQLSIANDFLELEPIFWGRAPKLVELAGAIRLSGKRWPITGSKYGVGNWCWNGYWMRITDAVAFLDWLHSRKLFDVSTAEQRVFNLWRSTKPFDKSDRKFLSRLLGKPSTWSA